MANRQAPTDDSKAEEGARVPKGQIDPDLVKLRRARTHVGVITSAGIVVLCVYFLLRLSPDRKFGGERDKPTAIALSDVLADRIAPESFVDLEAELLMSHAVRSVKAKGDAGLRVVPVRGTNDRLWLAITGDGWTEPTITGHYTGRLRKLDDLALAKSVKSYVAETPRPVFAKATDVRAALASGKVKLITGETIPVSDTQEVAFDIIEPGSASIIVSFNERFPDIKSWGGALKRAEIEAKPGTPKPNDEAIGQGRFDVALAPDAATKKLETAELFAARVEPVTRHRAGTWAELTKSPPDAIALGAATTPDAQIDVVGLYLTREIPEDAYALVTSETPQDYWYVMPITVALALIGLLFAWALVRAVRRDLLPARA